MHRIVRSILLYVLFGPSCLRFVKLVLSYCLVPAKL